MWDHYVPNLMRLGSTSQILTSPEFRSTLYRKTVEKSWCITPFTWTESPNHTSYRIFLLTLWETFMVYDILTIHYYF